MCLGHHHCFLASVFSRKLELEIGQELDLGTLVWSGGVPTCVFTAKPGTHPPPMCNIIAKASSPRHCFCNHVPFQCLLEHGPPLGLLEPSLPPARLHSTSKHLPTSIALGTSILSPKQSSEETPPRLAEGVFCLAEWKIDFKLSLCLFL